MVNGILGKNINCLPMENKFDLDKVTEECAIYEANLFFQTFGKEFIGIKGNLDRNRLSSVV